MLFSMFDAYLLFFVFCFFKQKTAYEMRISDWSSDVCSSDLWHQRISPRAISFRKRCFWPSVPKCSNAGPSIQMPKLDSGERALIRVKIGRASCRERVCQYV